MRSFKTTTLFLLALAAFPWRSSAQTYDSSGDAMLTGTYYLRQVIYLVQTTSDPEGTAQGDAVNTYGNITFDGKGNYTFSGSFFDAVSSSSPTQFTASGTYVISASGMGYITAVNPELSPTDLIIGLVSPKGIFIGSSTQNTQADYLGYNDLVIAAPVGSPQATNATLNGAYTVAYMDPTYFPATSALPGGDALITFTANGQGGITGNVSVNAYTSDNPAASTETLTGVTYAFSNGAAQFNFGGSNTALVQGTELLYISPDGNFIFGGSYDGFDMFVGVRAGTSNPTNYNGIYYQVGLDLDQTFATEGIVFLDSYYGALSVSSCTLDFPCSPYTNYSIGHQSLNSQLGYGGAADYTYDDFYTLNGDGSSTDAYFGQEYWSSADGTIRIGYGNSAPQGYDVLGINVALQTTVLTGSGVYLSPQGMVNAASSAPFTAHLSPGEYITLYGSGLAPSTESAPSLPLTNNLNGVQVIINGIAAPINFVSPTQISVVVPFETTQSVAQIQVINNSKPSNTVTQFVGTSSAGVFTYDPSGGVGNAAAQDVTAGYSLVGPSNPAQIGDTVAAYMAGLGTVTGSTAAGAAGPSASPYADTNNAPTVYIDDSAGNSTQAAIYFSGLAPGFAGLYQIDLAIPTGVAAGAAYLEISAGLNSNGGPDSDALESTLSVGPLSAARPAARAESGKRPFIHHHRLARPATLSGKLP
jgi:uncharacterized protein (TIGR03437 family)